MSIKTAQPIFFVKMTFANDINLLAAGGYNFPADGNIRITAVNNTDYSQVSSVIIVTQYPLSSLISVLTGPHGSPTPLAQATFQLTCVGTFSNGISGWPYSCFSNRPMDLEMWKRITESSPNEVWYPTDM